MVLPKLGRWRAARTGTRDTISGKISAM